MAAEKRLVLLKHANKLFRQGKAQAAIKEYKKVLEIKPDDLEVRRIVGDLELKESNVPGAVIQFEWIADYYLKEGFFAKAIAMYKRITRIDPNYVEVSFKLADLYTKQGLVIEAKQIYLDLAEEYKRKQNHKKALDMYKKILEFDRNNIKMRLLLADNYLREGLEDNAVSEYLTAADILIYQKDYSRAEELLNNVISKSKNVKLVEKLVGCYTAQKNEQKAIDLLKSLGSDLFSNINLLKLLGELYFRNNLLDDAEEVYKKITELDPEEKEVIMKLGKVYLQRKEFDKTFDLFLPVVDKSIEVEKFEEATSLLRFIIASNSTHLPALTKLASIFKISGKRNNLIALYESLIPIYEDRNMRTELEGILEELIELSDSSFTYQEQLARLRGEAAAGDSGSEQIDDNRKAELISFNLRIAAEALEESDFDKAISILQKTRDSFPNNIEVRLKLYNIFQKLNRIEDLIDEGVGLLDLYKAMNNVEEYNTLLDRLTEINPHDPRLVEMNVNEKTNIDIDFDHEELQEQMREIGGDANLRDLDFAPDSGPEDDVFVLSEDQSLISPMPEESEGELSKSFTSYMSELDFYINDGYFGDAERLIGELKPRYPGNELLMERMQRLELQKVESGRKEGGAVPVAEDDSFEIEKNSNEQTKGSDYESKSFIEISDEEDRQFELEPGSYTEHIPGFPAEESYDSEVEVLGEETDHGGDSEPMVLEEVPMVLEENPMVLDEEPIELEEEHIDLGPPVSDSSSDIQVDSGSPGDTDSSFKEFEENISFEIEEDSSGRPVENVPISELDSDFFQSVPDKSPATGTNSNTASGADFLGIDGIVEDTGTGFGSPFGGGADQQGFPSLESEDDLLGDDSFLLDVEEYFEIEKKVSGELQSIDFWIKELERQRTSTIEKNMREIFQEFKKGVDEKIGQEDVDTRYNLGIAYKEMGLLEEAIHEFLISAKQPVKFFDSAGLLGMCFREKGMFDDAISWFKKALNTPDRRQEEYLAIKYELLLCFRLQEDPRSAMAMIEDIRKENPTYRDIERLYLEISKKL